MFGGRDVTPLLCLPFSRLRTQHERLRKQLKDNWTRECRRFMDAVAALQRSKVCNLAMLRLELSLRAAENECRLLCVGVVFDFFFCVCVCVCVCKKPWRVERKICIHVSAFTTIIT